MTRRGQVWLGTGDHRVSPVPGGCAFTPGAVGDSSLSRRSPSSSRFVKGFGSSPR